MQSGLGAFPGWIDGLFFTLHDVAVKGVFDVFAAALYAEEPLHIGFIVSEKNFGRLFGTEIEIAEAFVAGFQFVADKRYGGLGKIAVVVSCPGPGIAIPELRQKVESSWLGTAIGAGDLYKYIVGCFLGIFNLYIEVVIVQHNAGVYKFEFRLQAREAAIDVHQFFIGVAALWVFVERLHIRVGGC